MRTVITATVAVLALTGCAGTTSDRSDEAGGRNPDSYADVSEVVIYRNADNVPNIASFCVDGVRFYSTLSLDGARVPQIAIAPEFAQTCGR